MENEWRNENAWGIVVAVVVASSSKGTYIHEPS